jgi:glutathione synthase/RimK-type ligase-like ATP-grasp enzyme
LFFELINLGYVPVLVYDQAETYLGNGLFQGHWQISLSAGKKLQYKHFDEKIQLHFIFNKRRFLGDDVAVSDPAEVREICKDKYRSYLFAPDLHPRSFLLENEPQLDTLKVFWKNHKIALKELDGNCGEKVFVGPLEDYQNDLAFPILAQEFIDTSVGVPGLCDGPHDLRVIIYNGEIISLLLRRPPKNGLKSNIGYGGRFDELDIKRTPAELKKIADDIDKRFNTKKDRLYSIDFANTKLGWRIFELNAWPGLGYDSDNEKLYTKRLARCLADSLERQLEKNK